MNAFGFTVVGHGRLGPLCPWKLYVSWWMPDLARAAAGDRFTSLLHHLQICMLLKLYWWDSSKFSLPVTSVIITYLVAFNATNMHIYHKVAIWHLMQAWASFALQCIFIVSLMLHHGDSDFNLKAWVRVCSLLDPWANLDSQFV